MSGLKVIITGATGMVGEGVLFECLQNEKVSEVLIVNRRHYELSHPKLKELIVPDFFQLGKFAENIKGYDACFFCAGISSVGMKEEKYTRYYLRHHFVFCKSAAACEQPYQFYLRIRAATTTAAKKAGIMWARVKGRTVKRSMRSCHSNPNIIFAPVACCHSTGRKTGKLHTNGS